MWRYRKQGNCPELSWCRESRARRAQQGDGDRIGEGKLEGSWETGKVRGVRGEARGRDGASLLAVPTARPQRQTAGVIENRGERAASLLLLPRTVARSGK